VGKWAGQTVGGRSSTRIALLVEELETRALLSASLLDSLSAVPFAPPGASITNPTPTGYIPSQIRHAYGFDAIAGQGDGQTIAIVDAYYDPNIKNDVNVFSSTFGLPLFNQSGGPTFSQAIQVSGARFPKGDSGWALETALDVEWAHAIAPR